MVIKVKTHVTSRNGNIDILKAVCAFLIVCIHIKFQEKVDFFISPIDRCGVPIFFMISGYFYSFNWRKKEKNNQILKFLKIAVLINLFYLVVNGIVAAIGGKTIGEYLSSTVGIKQLILLLVTNDNAISGHLWYLSAILYVVLIFRLFSRLNKLGRKRYIIIILLLLGDLIFGKYSILILHRIIPLWMSRNFLFVGVPFFWIGNIIQEKQENEHRINNNILVLLIVLFYITTLLENIFLMKLGTIATRDHAISTTLMAVVIFVFAISATEKNSRLEVVGRKYSANIYYFHPFVITVCELLLTDGVGKVVFENIGPIVVFIFTLGMLVSIDILKAFIRSKTIE